MWLTRVQAAQYLGTTVGTLATWRSQGKGPRFSRPNGGKCLYNTIDLDAWAASHPIQPDENQNPRSEIRRNARDLHQ